MKDLYARLAEFSGDGVYRCTWDEGKILCANQGLMNILEIDGAPATMVGKRLGELFGDAEKEKLLRHLVSKQGEARGLEHHLTTLKGKEKWVIHDAFIAEESVTKKKVIEGIVRDITRLKITEGELKKRLRELVEARTAELRASEAKYRTLIEQLPAITYIAALDEPSTSLFVSPQISLLGLTQEECRADPDFWRKHLHPDDRERVLEQLARNCTSDHPFSSEYRMMTKEGGVLWVRDEAIVVRDEAGRPLFLQGVMFDITKDRKAAYELSALQRQSEFVLGATKTGLDIIDSQFTVRYIDPEWGKVYGDPTGRKCYEYFMGRSGPCPGCGIPTALETKKPAVTEQLLVKEGNRPIQVTTFPFQDESGEWMVAEVNVDITERKRMEEELKRHRDRLEQMVGERTAALMQQIAERAHIQDALEEREAFLANVFASIHDGISILDKEMTILRVNPTMERWYAHAMPLVGKKCYQAYHGRQERCEVCPTHTALETGRAAYDVVPKTGPGGTIVGWLDLFSFPLVERETGEFTGVIEYVRDITERKRTEEALRESEEKYRAVISGASDGIVLFDMVGNVLESNTAAEELLGYSKEELRGVHFAQFAVPREKARLENGFAELIRTGRGFVNDVLAERKDGSTFSIDITGSVIGYAGMKVVQGIFRDVSERKRIELMKENLIRDVSHELKAPIAMMEMAQAMCREAVDAGDMDGVGKALQMTARNLKTLSRDVGSILSSFTLRGRRGERPKRLVSLARVIRAVADDLRPLMAQKKLRFRVDIAAGADKVAVERRGLRMLVYNIMDNAVKFTKRGGISVTARPEENWVRLRMRDTGLGIAAKDGPSLFERFYKANPAIQGTGLGLSICKEIAEMYGGMITVESEGAGRGTTVTVTLPRRL